MSDDIQKRIDHYNRLLTQRFDPLTEERMKAAIAELEGIKAESQSPPQLAASKHKDEPDN